jgi:hypothetical protein
MGICGFKYFEESNKLECFPFNFYIQPFHSSEYDFDLIYSNSVATMKFMADSRFDFNKLMYQSVGYLSFSEHNRYLKKREIKDL